MPETLSVPIRVRPVSVKNTELPAPSKQLPATKSFRKSGLTKKQDTAIALLMSGLNMYQAAIQAGYSESVANVAGKEIFYKPEVMAEMRRQITEAVALEEFSPENILRKLLICANWNILDYGEVDERGQIKFDFRRIDRIQAYAIEGITYDNNGRAVPQFSSHARAWETLARIAKMFDREVRGSGEDGGPLTIQSLDAIVQKVTNNITVNNITVANDKKEHKQLEAQVIDAQE